MEAWLRNRMVYWPATIVNDAPLKVVALRRESGVEGLLCFVGDGTLRIYLPHAHLADFRMVLSIP